MVPSSWAHCWILSSVGHKFWPPGTNLEIPVSQHRARILNFRTLVETACPVSRLRLSSSFPLSLCLYHQSKQRPFIKTEEDRQRIDSFWRLEYVSSREFLCRRHRFDPLVGLIWWLSDLIFLLPSQYHGHGSAWAWITSELPFPNVCQNILLM